MPKDWLLGEGGATFAPRTALMLDLVQILVVDDDHDASRALVQTLGRHGYVVRGVTSAIESALTLARTAHVALVTLSPSATFDATAIARALINQCDIAVLYVVERIDDALLRRARETCPNGFIFEPYTAEALYGAIEVTRPLRASDITASYSRELTDERQLTPREREIFDAMLRGMRPPEIARTFFISVHTVRRHAQAVFRKLDVHSQIELMNRYGAGGTRRHGSG
jgi:two-component system response regulator FixJ